MEIKHSIIPKRGRIIKRKIILELYILYPVGFWKTRKGRKSVSSRKIVFHLEFHDDAKKNSWKDIETSPLYHMSVFGTNQMIKIIYWEHAEIFFSSKIDLNA